MIAFDSATTGAAQLVYKAYLRTLKVEGLRDIISAGGPAMNGIMAYVDVMRRYQGQEGITLLDSTDTFEVQQHSAFSGLSDALNQFGQQLSGALQIPLVRLFGQSPAGLSASGESDMRMYYDNVNQQQNKTMRTGVTLIYQLIAKSKGVTLPENFSLRFTSLWQLKDTEKADIAQKVATTISGAYADGLISQKTALQELRDLGRVTGVFTNITDEMIEAADDTLAPPGGMGEGAELGGEDPVAQVLALYGKKENSDEPKGAPGTADHGASRRIRLQP
jgi:phage-related protein (TIGR01555 family)